ncbi:MAG: hypothetical protein VW625_10810 [Perlucidibaca sp.]
MSITGDYLLAPVPYLAPPRADNKALASLAYSAAGVDTGSITIRGGTHFDFNDIPAVLPASKRGIDLVTWYTVAWFAKYLQQDANADRMLLSARWREDAETGELDTGGDANLYSWHYNSRLDVRLANGRRFACENLRNGCPGQYLPEEDCGPETYSFAGVVADGASPVRVCRAP